MAVRNANLDFPVLDALPLGAHRVMALTDEALYAQVGVRIAFTSRDGGVSVGPYASLNCASHVGDDPEAVARNRRIVCEAAGAASSKLVVANQVHGTDLHWAGGDEPNPEADGILVKRDGVAAMLNFADCLPLIVVSPSGRFAVVHAGWRGAVGHIAAKAVRELSRDDEAPAASYNAYIGAHIRSECFEVGPEVEERFRSEFGNEAVAAPRHVSLARAVSADLERAGLDPRRIADAGICTKCHPERYYSYRASDGVCGRHTAFAVKVEDVVSPA